MAFVLLDGFESERTSIGDNDWTVLDAYNRTADGEGYQGVGRAATVGTLVDMRKDLGTVSAGMAVRSAFAYKRPADGTFTWGYVDRNQEVTTNYSDAHLSVNANGGFSVRVSSTLYDTTASEGLWFPADSWVWCEWYGVWSSGGAFEVRINGVPAVSGTWSPATEAWAYLSYRPTSVTGHLLDDVMVEVDAGTAWWGPSKVLTLQPTGTATGEWAGSDGNSVDNHLLVDDGQKASADYVSSTAGSNQTDEYTFDAFSGGEAVHAVRAFASVEQDVAGTSGFSLFVDSAGSESAANAAPGVGAPDWARTPIIAADPSTGSGWTGAAADAVKVGIRTQAV